MFRYAILFFVLPLLLSSCKRDIAGCNDIEATNWSQKANLNDGSCKYLPLILDPSFETWSDWTTYSGTGYSASAGFSSVGDGFMPTHGKSFFIAIPSVNKTNGTASKQFLKPNRHFKGFFFDYSYIGKGTTDSVLEASCGIGILSHVPGTGSFFSILWMKNLSENAATYGTYPNIKIQKKDEYVELPYTDYDSELILSTKVSKGTFTFQVDNIREVPR